MEETVLVTGGCGFIGGRLVAALKGAGHSVRVLDILMADFSCVEGLGAKVVKGSVADGEAVRKALGNSRVVFHMVGVPGGIEEEGFIRRAIVAGAEVLMEEVDGSEVRQVVAASSTGVYAPSDRVEDEGSPLKPRNRLHRAKLDMERALRKGASATGAHVTCLRLPSVYGKGDGGIVDMLVPQVAITGEAPIVMPTRGWVSTVHVDDVVAAARHLATPTRELTDGSDDEGGFEVLNCVDDAPMTPAELLRVVAAALGVAAPIPKGPGLLGGGASTWTDRQRTRGLVERCRLLNGALKRAVPGWPMYPSLKEGLELELGGQG